MFEAVIKAIIDFPNNISVKEESIIKHKYSPRMATALLAVILLYL